MCRDDIVFLSSERQQLAIAGGLPQLSRPMAADNHEEPEQPATGTDSSSSDLQDTDV